MTNTKETGRPNPYLTFGCPPWAMRALIPRLLASSDACPYSASGHDLDRETSIWDPACRYGTIANTLKETFPLTVPTDNFQYTDHEHEIIEFVGEIPSNFKDFDWIITSPPLNFQDEFVEKAFDNARFGFAFFLPISFLSSENRYKRLFTQAMEPTHIYQFTENVGYTTPYAWMIWDFESPGADYEAIFRWIPPCKEELTKECDSPPIEKM